MELSRLIILCAALAGCDVGVTHDVDYFTEHPEERRETMKECANDVRMAISANCLNADEATRRDMANRTTMPKLRF